MSVKFQNYNALFIYENGKRSMYWCDFANEALQRFKANKAVKMVLFKATHNNTRLKLHGEYGLEFK